MMDESNLSHNTDNSLFSRETEANSVNTSSTEGKFHFSIINESQIIKAIVSNLNDIIEENRKRINMKYISKDNIFYLEQLPNISFGDYILHLMKYTHINISTLVLAVIYIDKFCEKFKYVLTLHNIHRIILISIFISMKYNEDCFVNANIYAQIAGVCTEDLLNLELNMCVALEFGFYVKEELYQQYFVYFSKYSS
jgi:hypothetical protein